MKMLPLLHRILVLTGMLSSFVMAPNARADLSETLAEEKALKAKVAEYRFKVESQNRRFNDNKGVSSITLSVLKDYEKQLAKAEKALKGVQTKIARQRSEAAKDAARDAAKDAAQHTARDAAIAAAKDATKAGAKDAAKEASKAASKDSTKSSGQSAGHEAAKSAAHPPAPKMH